MALRWIPNWQELAQFTEAQLATIDIALVNLACAIGLPGSERIDVDLCLDKLDEWATRVRGYTERCEPDFRRNPHRYKNSEAYFRSLSLVTALWKQCKVCYNEAKIPEHVSLGVEDIFIHGIIQGQGGTCASLPVLCAAVGRRLGYPIKLASTRAAKVGHLFVRWDGGGEYLNIEVTKTGLSCQPDNYYRTGIYALPPDHERWGYFLKSQTPYDELAGFLGERGNYLLEIGRHRQAANAFAWALVLQPGNKFIYNSVVETCIMWRALLQAAEPPGFPELYPTWPPRRFPVPFPEEFERAILTLEAWDDLVRDPQHERNWWGPMRRGERLAIRPVKARVLYTSTGCEIGFEVVHNT